MNRYLLGRLLAGAALLAITVTPASLSAQATRVVQGRVIDARLGSALAGAEVSIDAATRPTRTAADGSWRLDRVAPGEHHLRVRRIGYLTAELTVRIAAAGDSAIVVPLVPSARVLDEVVTTASRREQRLQDVATTTEVVSRADIEATGASDLAAVLAEQTGMQFTGGHPSGAGVALEGLSDQRVLVLLDGQPLYGRISGGLDLARIPTSIVERVEVVKGPQSTLYGSEAMGGVINIITRGAVPGPSDVELRTLVGGSRRSDSDLLATLGRESFTTTVNLGHRYVERTPGVAGTIGALTDRLDGMATIRATPTTALALDAGALVVNERQRWPSGTLYSFADNTQLNAHVGGSWTAGERRLATTVSVAQLDHLSRASQFPQPIAGTGDRQTQRLTQAELLGSWRAGSAMIDAGVPLRREFISSTDGRILGGSRTLSSAEPYVQADWTSARWSVVPGARLALSEQWGRFVSPRVAVRFRADSSLTIRSSLGRGFRAPDFKELYLDFANDAAFYAVHGNPDLRPEHADNVSLGAEWDGERVYARGQLYWNELYDFIETRALPQEGQFSQFTYGNISRGRTRGLEAESGVTVGVVRVAGGYALLRTRDDASGGPLLGQAGSSARLSLTAPLAGASVTATGLYTGRTPMERDDDGTVSGTRDPFTRLDLRAARPVLGRAVLSAGIDNLFDTHPARWADPTGRQVYLAVSWRMRPAGR